jgi:hypothetical protein
MRDRLLVLDGRFELGETCDPIRKATSAGVERATVRLLRKRWRAAWDRVEGIWEGDAG